MARINTHAGVAFLLGEVKVALHISQGLKLARNIVGLGFDFLHANTIRRKRLQPRLKPFAGG